MGRLRLIDGGKQRPSGGLLDDDDGDSENTVVTSPELLKQMDEIARASEPRIYEAVEDPVIEPPSPAPPAVEPPPPPPESQLPLPPPRPSGPIYAQPEFPPAMQQQPPQQPQGLYTPPAGYPAVPGYAAPPSGAYYATPYPMQAMPGMPGMPAMPVAAAPPTKRRTGLLIAGLILMPAVGLGIGWALFARGHGKHEVAAAPAAAQAPAAASAAPATATAPATAHAAPAVATAPAAAAAPSATPAAPAAPATVRADITSLDHPALAQLTAPLQGEVAFVAPAEHAAAKGEKVFAIKHRRPPSSNQAALAHRVAELQGLAKQDPASYGPFLARARRDLERAQAQQIDVSAVDATTAGVVESKVHVGDQVAQGAPLGALVDPTSWVAVAMVPGTAPTASWSCAVVAADHSHSAACKIQTTEAVPGSDGGTRVTAQISATGTAWLDGSDQHPQLELEPPNAR